MLELREVSHFDGNAPGWFRWHGSTIRGLHAEEFGFYSERVEVARARVYPAYPLIAPYVGLPPGEFTAIDLIVVREDLQGFGTGPEALKLLVDRYLGCQMIAFSANDRFWEKEEWIRAVRADGDKSAMPLFVRPV